jgi:hypothetical protein
MLMYLDTIFLHIRRYIFAANKLTPVYLSGFLGDLSLLMPVCRDNFRMYIVAVVSSSWRWGRRI